MITHEVENQAPPRVGVDEYAANVPLVEAVARWGRGADASAQGLHEIGELVGSAGFQRDAERANSRTPELRTHDRWGHRVDEARTPARGPSPGLEPTSIGRRRSCSSHRSSRGTPAPCP